MLCVKPSYDEKLNKELIGTTRIIGDNPVLLTAIENEKLVGYAVLDPIGSDIRIASLNIPSMLDPENPDKDDFELAEYLVRAAANYAYNRLMSTLSFDDLQYKPILSRFAFEEIDNKFQLDIKVLFKKCENCLSGH